MVFVNKDMLLLHKQRHKPSITYHYYLLGLLVAGSCPYAELPREKASMISFLKMTEQMQTELQTVNIMFGKQYLLV